jgi:glutamyl-tRNA synthetase
MAEQASILLRDPIDLRSESAAKAVKKHLKPAALPLVESLHLALEKLDVEEWSEGQLESVFEAVSAHHENAKLGKIAQPVRVAITGGPVSPGIYETMVAIGKRRCMPRLADAIELMRERKAAAEQS